VSAHNHLQGGAVFEVCLPVSNAVAWVNEYNRIA
jgi:hypothetical protein